MTLPIAINPVVLVALIGFLASTLSGILRQDRLPGRDYINAGITAVFMIVAAVVSLLVAGHALDWTSILAEVGVIMLGPGAALEGFLQVKVNTGIPFLDSEIAQFESQIPAGLKATSAAIPQAKKPTPIVFPKSTGNGPDHAG